MPEAIRAQVIVDLVVNLHIRTADEEGPPGVMDGHVCVDCGTTWPSAQALSGHRKVHRVRPAAAHPCPDCPNVFGTLQALGVHRYRMHGYRSAVSGPAKAARQAEQRRARDRERKAAQRAILATADPVTANGEVS